MSKLTSLLQYQMTPEFLRNSSLPVYQDASFGMHMILSNSKKRDKIVYIITSLLYLILSTKLYVINAFILISR